jgi:hypothetical protein
VEEVCMMGIVVLGVSLVFAVLVGTAILMQGM